MDLDKSATKGGTFFVGEGEMGERERGEVLNLW